MTKKHEYIMPKLIQKGIGFRSTTKINVVVFIKFWTLPLIEYCRNWSRHSRKHTHWICPYIHSITHMHGSRILGQWVMVELRGVEGYQFSRVLEGGGGRVRFVWDPISAWFDEKIFSPKSKRGLELINHFPLGVMSMSCVLKPIFRSSLIKLHVWLWPLLKQMALVI